MATPQEKRPQTLEEAVQRLQLDPARSVRVQVGELQVELRVVSGGTAPNGLGDVLAAAGPWEGESTEEIIRILREGRDAGGSADAVEGL
jgi:hypothetical protein